MKDELNPGTPDPSRLPGRADHQGFAPPSQQDVDVLDYVKEIFDKISLSHDIESTLFIIMDIINSHLAPESSFILTHGGETLLENSSSPPSTVHIQRLDQEGVLSWVRKHGRQRSLTTVRQTIVVDPLSIEAKFQGHLVLVLNRVDIPPRLLDLISISAQIVSVVLSKKQMSQALIEKSHCLRNLKLHAQYVEKKRIERDLELARDIQARLLPEKPPKIKGLEIKTFFKPAHQVGGDYYDFHLLNALKGWCFLGDVAGKGSAAAIIMATLRSMLRAELRKSFAYAGNLLTGLNTLLCPDVREGGFVTFFAGFIDMQRERVMFSNAGHPPLLVYRQEEDRIESFEALTMPLGIADDTIYPTQSIPFRSQDILLLYTDGIHEARNPSKEEFGLERLRTVFQQAHRWRPERIVQAVLKAVEDFREELPQHDDITLMVIKRT